MNIPPITQTAREAAERYFAMRKHMPEHADRALAEIIQCAINADKTNENPARKVP